MKLKDILTLRDLFRYLLGIAIFAAVVLFIAWKSSEFLYRWEISSYEMLFPKEFGNLTLLEDRSTFGSCRFLAFELNADRHFTVGELATAISTRHQEDPLELQPWQLVSNDRSVLHTEGPVATSIGYGSRCGDVQGPAQIDLAIELGTGKGFFTTAKQGVWVLYFSVEKQRVYYLVADQ